MIDSTKPIAALFDLDGVILDTETQYTFFWNDMGEKYLHKENCGLILKGMSLELIYATYFGNDTAITSCITKKLNEFESSMKMEYIPGTHQFVQELKTQGLKCAVVTSSNQPKMQSVYRQHPELPFLFDCILTAELFTRSKPAPDCYLLGATVFGTIPDNCFVFEDSINGLKAGQGAQMTVIGLSTTNTKETVMPFSQLVIPDFSQLRYADILNCKTTHNFCFSS